MTYDRGDGKVGFFRTDRIHRLWRKRFAPVLGKTTLLKDKESKYRTKEVLDSGVMGGNISPPPQKKVD